MIEACNTLPTHCEMCGMDWPEEDPTRCTRCSGLKCTKTVDVVEEDEILCLGAANRLPPVEIQMEGP